VGWQRHDRNRADFLQSKIEVDEFDDIRKLDNHAVKRLNSLIEEIERQACRALVDLSIGDRLIPVDDRDTIGVAHEKFVERVAQRAIFPIASGQVGPDKLRW
jgi:hypothetical protein